MEDGFLEKMTELSGVRGDDASGMPPLVLAYIGDAVYELFVRTYLVGSGSSPVHKLHRRSVEYVKASAQSGIVHRLAGLLNAEEQDIVRRGRNAKSGTIPKNADVTEYKHATGFEALVGYLYLKGDYERLMYILRQAVRPESGV